MTAPFLGSASDVTRQRLRARRYLRLTRDVYVLGVDPDDVDLRLRSRAALLVHPDAVLCRETAAALLRLPVDEDGLVHLARGPGAPRSERPGVRTHRLLVPPAHRLDLRGLVVTSPARTLADLAAVLPLEALVAVADVVVRRVDEADMAAVVAAAEGRPGVRRLRSAVQLADGRSGSPAETRARLRLHEAGYARMRHGVVVRDAGGGWLAEPDLADEVARVAVQYDGDTHLQGDPEQRRADLLRDDLSRASDWEVVVATARDDRHPHLVLDGVAEAYLRSARLRGPEVLPPHLLSRYASLPRLR